MRLNSLKLTHFRNYEDQEVTFAPGINVFIGENAQGKTNLLEAIYMLSLARSHRTAKDREVIGWGADFARLEGILEKKHTTVPLTLTLTKHGKAAKVNHLEQRRLSDYVGMLNVVLFAPEDLELVKGSPQQRRKFIDMELSQMNARYLHESSQYQRLLKQRNAYLKQLQRRETTDQVYLEVLTEQLIQSASMIMLMRQQFIDQLETIARPIHEELSEGKETLSVKYLATIALPETKDHPEAELQSTLMAHFKDVKSKEIEKGVTLFGPQREDVTFFINGQEVQKFGSQGQQRTTALSLKLAEIECMEQVLGDYPILLLDDVLSELDDRRQTHLLKAIESRTQTFLTTTSLDGVKQEQIHQPTLFHIEGGHVKREVSD
ncbi:MAG: DNA replication/repair protein RecF [Aerococcus sp.]|nr:DNA replication/repair protein RecF [Aerococcus sp.]